jgi:hypothetical protein
MDWLFSGDELGRSSWYRRHRFVTLVRRWSAYNRYSAAAVS